MAYITIQTGDKIEYLIYRDWSYKIYNNLNICPHVYFAELHYLLAVMLFITDKDFGAKLIVMDVIWIYYALYCVK